MSLRVTQLGRANNASRSFGLQRNNTYTYDLKNPMSEARKPNGHAAQSEKSDTD
jgi:hypothetical protein